MKLLLQSALLALLALFAVGCSITTTTPPFADTKTSDNYSYIKAVENQLENLFVYLASADNEYAARALFEGHNVTEMYLLPGKHVLNVWCFRGGISTQLGMDLEIDFEAKKSYELTCKLQRNGTGANFILTDSISGERKPYKYVRTTDSSGKKERTK